MNLVGVAYAFNYFKLAQVELGTKYFGLLKRILFKSSYHNMLCLKVQCCENQVTLKA